MKGTQKHVFRHPKASKHILESLGLVTLSFGLNRDRRSEGQAVVGWVMSESTFQDQIGFGWGLVIPTGGGSPCSKPSRNRVEHDRKVFIYWVKVGVSHYDIIGPLLFMEFCLACKLFRSSRGSISRPLPLMWTLRWRLGRIAPGGRMI